MRTQFVAGMADKGKGEVTEQSKAASSSGGSGVRDLMYGGVKAEPEDSSDEEFLGVEHPTEAKLPNGKGDVEPSRRNPFAVTPPRFSIAARAVAPASSIYAGLSAMPPQASNSDAQVDLTNESDNGSSVDNDDSGTYHGRANEGNPLAHAEIVVTSTVKRKALTASETSATAAALAHSTKKKRYTDSEYAFDFEPATQIPSSIPEVIAVPQ